MLACAACSSASDGYVLDGHHQWVAALDKGTDVRVIRLNAPIRDLITAAHAFPSSRTSEGGSQVQPDMFGGTPLTAEQMDARRFAPRVMREVTKSEKLDDLWDATDYVLRRSEKESATPGDKAQSVKELSQVTGRTLSRKEAVAYALELERMRDSGETGKPKTKSEKRSRRERPKAIRSKSSTTAIRRHARKGAREASTLTRLSQKGLLRKVIELPGHTNELPETAKEWRKRRSTNSSRRKLERLPARPTREHKEWVATQARIHRARARR
jgi:hypothetical protein